MRDDSINSGSVTTEQALWGGLLLLTAISRFWNLGQRALHHDEGLHVWYSWIFATGQTPYVHNPLMHGPFLFHANALIYLLFDATDATSRWLPALAGVLIVAACWYLRPEHLLGRWGSLSAAFLLAISPTFLFYTRFIRHDPYTALGSLILCIAIFRYLACPQRRWMIAAFLAVALLVTNHEIAFAILALFALTLWAALILTTWRMLIPIHLAAAALLFAIIALHHLLSWRSLPPIPWEFASPAETRHFYEQIVTNPLVISLLVLGLTFIIACLVAMHRQSRRQSQRQDLITSLLPNEHPGTVGWGVRAALHDWRGLLAGSAVAALIIVGLFTTLFTNLHGLATMTYAPDGTLLYWLGQQSVERGHQPWFYFVIEAVQYEWLAILLALPALGVVGWRLVPVRKSGHPRSKSYLLFQTFLAVWFTGMALILSWAGEKMPWLLMHITLPAILLGASVLNEIVTSAIRVSRRHLTPIFPSVPIVTASLVVLTGGWFLLASRLTAPVWIPQSDGTRSRSLDPWAQAHWWLLALPPVAALAVIVLGLIRSGLLPMARATILATLIVCTMFQIHAGFRLSYLQSDTAIDMLIYNTTSPDVTTLSDDLHHLSGELYGDLSLPVGVATCNSLNVPTDWYLRDMPNRRYMNAPDIPMTTDLPPVVIGATRAMSGGDCTFPDNLPGYTAHTYVFRWHESEYANYRSFALAPEIPPGYSAWKSEDQPHGIVDILDSVWSSMMTLTTTAGQQRAFRLVMFREMPAGTADTEFRVYIRNDILPQYLDIHYAT